MAETVAYVSAGKPAVGGAVYVGDTTVTLPSDATTAIATVDADYKGLGYCGEDGLVNSNSPSVTDIKAWGGDKVLGVLEERPDTFTFKLLEVLNVDVLKTIYGSSKVTGTLAAGIKVSVGADEPSDMVWVFEMIMRGGALKRIVLPCAKITELADISYTDSDATGYEITVTAYPDSTGHSHYEYIYKAA